MSCLGVYLSSEYLLILVKNLNGKIFKFMLLRLPKNAFVSQKLNLYIFNYCPKKNSTQVLILTPKVDGNYPFPPGSAF